MFDGISFLYVIEIESTKHYTQNLFFSKKYCNVSFIIGFRHSFPMPLQMVLHTITTQWLACALVKMLLLYPPEEVSVL